ncbi:phage minor head protein [Marinobacter sp. MCTG268]|uniref:phage minor head protein n=1 Tax=Marinobacter adhaerens TaxID=1033846 RepID=UPI00068C341D
MAEYGSRPFAEQLSFFREKINLPTRTFRDIQGASNARAFVVAGAMRDDLLADFRQAIDKAIAKGTTLQEFRKDFEQIVERRGWTGWTGERSAAGRAWRTRIIYQTNLRTSYHAGRYKQMKATAQARPFWRYRHSIAVENPRVDHKSWDGLILRHDDPWWDIHYPPNGWGCQCFVESLAQRDLDRLGKAGPDDAPTDPGSTEGVGEGWRYNVGEAAWGRPVSERAYVEANDRQWESLAEDDWRSLGLPEELPVDRLTTPLAQNVDTKTAIVSEIRTSLGGSEERVFELPAGPFTYPLVVNAQTLGDHLSPERSRFIPWIPAVLDNPAEVWATFERNRKTGRIALRVRALKVAESTKERGTMMVMEAVAGQLVGWTFIRMSPRRLNAKRVGKLLYQRQ